jgi:hypothetical protein
MVLFFESRQDIIIQKLFPDALQLFEGDICGMIKHRAEARAARSNLAATRQQADNTAAQREQSFNINVTTWTAKCCTPLRVFPSFSKRLEQVDGYFSVSNG